MLTPEHITELRRPYNMISVKWLPVGGYNKQQGFLPHLDSSLVIERLNDIDPCWTEQTTYLLNNEKDLGVTQLVPTQCLLTVHGVTRSGIGQLDNANLDGKYAKQAESDALKRAALKFGIGAYLRAIPLIYIPNTEKNKQLFTTYEKTFNGKTTTKFKYLTNSGRDLLRDKYTAITTHPLFVSHYGEPVNYGDIDYEQQDIDIAEEETGRNPNELLILQAINNLLPKPATDVIIDMTYERQNFLRVFKSIATTLKETREVAPVKTLVEVAHDLVTQPSETLTIEHIQTELMKAK